MFGFQMDRCPGQTIDGSAPHDVGSVDEWGDSRCRAIDVVECDRMGSAHVLILCILILCIAPRAYGTGTQQVFDHSAGVQSCSP
jgi:hypothetical protein